MVFDELELKRIDNSVGGLCRKRTRPEYRAELEFVYEIEGHSVSIYEIRPDWQDSSKKTKMGVARFRYTRARGEWRLYWMRRDLRWHLYDPDVSVSKQLEPLVDVVATDRSGAFSGKSAARGTNGNGVGADRAADQIAGAGNQLLLRCREVAPWKSKMTAPHNDAVESCALRAQTAARPSGGALASDGGHWAGGG